MNYSTGLIVGASGKSSPLASLNFDERVSGVFMAPLEVLLLLAPLQSVEITIILMLLSKILTVSTILVAVPGVVVVPAFIVVALFLVVLVVSSRCNRSD
jgi:hypothetical protein